MTQQRAVIFLHISKTGGTTLRSIISQQYPHELIYDTDPSYFVSESSEYVKVYKERIDNLKSLSDRQRNAFRCVFHAGDYGIHQILPQPASYITVLRDPIDRTISDYYYALNEPDHINHDKFVKNNVTFEEYLDRGYASNLQTRRLIESSQLDVLNPNIPLAADIVENAKHNLEENVAVVGLLDRYDESVLMMKEAFGWSDVRYIPRNVASKRKAIEDLPSTTRKKMEELLAPDLGLYECGMKQFQRQLEEQGADFNRRLDQFRRRNRQYARMLGLKKRIRKQLRWIMRR